MAGPSSTSHTGLFGSIMEKVRREELMTAVALESSQTFNLKSALKYINQYATNRTLDVADEEVFESVQKVRPMK